MNIQIEWLGEIRERRFRGERFKTLSYIHPHQFSLLEL